MLTAEMAAMAATTLMKSQHSDYATRIKAQQDYLDVLAASVEAEAAYLEARVDLEGAVDRPLEEISR